MLLRSLFFFFLISGLLLPVYAQKCDSSKSATAPFSQFSNAASATITDNKNKNTWLRCPVGMAWDGSSCGGISLKYTWTEALVEVDELNAKQYAGRNDWRLPTVEELITVVEQRCFKPAIDLKAFPYSPESGFWTDTLVDGVQPRAWVVHFLNGNQYIANKNQTWRLRLIAGK